MGWPKGKPRKGHINADGTPHKAKVSAKVSASSDMSAVGYKTIRISPLSGGHIPNRKMVRHCHRCRDYFSGKPSFRLVLDTP